MSFFDEVDEPPPTRSVPRRPTRRRRPSGAGGPPGDSQQIQTRRAIAVVVIVIVIVLVALGVHSCQVSARNSSLKDYNTSVYSLIGDSNGTGAQLFYELQHSGSTSASSLQQEILRTGTSAQDQLNRAQSLSVPGQMSNAQSHLVFALTMRRDGIKAIASQIEQALGTSDSNDAVDAIAAADAHFYASDVVYKSYVVPEIAAALHSADISVGGLSGQGLQAGQFLPALGWLEPSFVATTLGAKLPGNNGPAGFQPGLHGHVLNSVSVGSNTLQPGVTNQVAASPAPSFTLSITNGGHFDEFNVECKVTIKGLNDSGSTKISETTPGETTTCQVPLPSAPTTGIFQVTAEVVPVQGESNKANNFMTFTVQFT